MEYVVKKKKSKQIQKTANDYNLRTFGEEGREIHCNPIIYLINETWPNDSPPTYERNEITGGKSFTRSFSEIANASNGPNNPDNEPRQ